MSKEEPKTAADWSSRMCDLRAVKPRPLIKLYGNNPTDAQKAQHKQAMKAWDRLYRAASKTQKAALEKENEAFWAGRV